MERVIRLDSVWLEALKDRLSIIHDLACIPAKPTRYATRF
jgi:hypothetical protein